MNQTSTALISQAQVHEHAEGWHRAVFDDIRSRLAGDSDFPCVFSKNAFRKQLLKFVFVERVDEPGIRRLGASLGDYVKISRQWDGSIDTAYPLIVAFSREAVRARTLEGHHAFGWKVLQSLHDVDPAPWPAGVGQDPNSDAWSMCFDGLPLFCNMSSPAHRVRRSRNLAEHFILVINPAIQNGVFMQRSEYFDAESRI